MSQVTGNETVKLHYTGKLNDGQVFDSSVQQRATRGKTWGGSIDSRF